MKKLLFAGLLLAGLPLFAQKNETIEGNGQLKKETRNVAAFTSLASAGAFDVQINYGNSGSISLEAEENLLPYIETTVEDGELRLGVKKGYNVRSKKKIQVTVSMTRMTGLKVAGSGNVEGSGDFSNDGTTKISVAGSGDVKLNFGRFNQLEVSISGSGNMKLKGRETSKITAAVSGSGNIDAYDVTANEVTAKVSGSGNVNVTANRSVDAAISGSGNVNYKGSASDIKQKTSGSGKVRKV